MKLTTIAAAAALAVASMSASAATYVPGTYTYKVNAHNAAMTVAVTVSKHKIEKIDWSKNLETIGVGQLALEKVGGRILEKQSLGVDCVTGATISSMALKYAVGECLKQAKVSAEDLKDLKKNVEEYKALPNTMKTQVVIIGGGGSGLAAAVAASQAGADVIVLEKLGLLGGSTNVSEGALNAADPIRQPKLGIEDSVAKHIDQTLKGGHNVGNPELVKHLCEGAYPAVEWLESIGVKFKDEVGTATGALWQRSHYPATPSGNSYIRVFEKYIAEHPNVQVITDIEAKNIGCTNFQKSAQGSGILMGKEVGANVIGMADIQVHPCGTPGTGLMEMIRTSGRNRVFINTDGNRFVNEGAARDVLAKAIFAQKDSTYYVLVNHLRYPSLTWVDRNGAKVGDMIDLGRVVAADTLEELAAKLKMPVENLKGSIDIYNAVVRGEKKDPLGFVANNKADKVMTEGPWYACQKVPTVHHTMGGLQINADAQVLDINGKVIPGLYAAGETTGGIHGSNRLGGNAIADCMVFGRTAGTNAAQGK